MTRIIVVDLDGTLINSDMLFENFFRFVRNNPKHIFLVLLWLLRGKVYLKSMLSLSDLPDFESLPYNKVLVDWLQQQKNAGARLVLATASHIRIAMKVADHLGIFDDVIATEEINLSSHNKRRVLVDRFGEMGFEYVGNSSADLAVGRSSRLNHIANANAKLLKKVHTIGRIGQVFNSPTKYLRVLPKAMRLHQWAKNFLVFVPLLASHRLFETTLVLNGVIAFLAFGACASSVYLLNDLLDISDDRKHPTKRKRPLAAGTLPQSYALFLIPTLLIFAFALSLLTLPLAFTLVLFVYYLLTILYSFWLKRVVMFDVILLSILYSIRVIAGSAAMSLTVTSWIMAFCMFIFLSLAFVKRYTELYDNRSKGQEGRAAGRGYHTSDFELLASLGGASGYISVLVLALYINDNSATALYSNPTIMWAACPLLLFWISRVWLLAHRGQMHDDPIVFAIKDRPSRLIGVLFFTVFAAAAL